MLPHASTTRQPTAPAIPARSTPIGVGIDTSRYGHYATFLRADFQPAAAELSFAESAAGYAQLRQRLQHVLTRHGGVHFLVRLDAAGQYADNLLHFLDRLAVPDPANSAGDPALFAHATFAISCGDPQRNKNYRAALFGSKKTDPIEACAAARFALSERPAPVKIMPPALRTLRQVAGRLRRSSASAPASSINSITCWP
jgi:hypothetical protein